MLNFLSLEIGKSGDKFLDLIILTFSAFSFVFFCGFILSVILIVVILFSTAHRLIKALIIAKLDLDMNPGSGEDIKTLILLFFQSLGTLIITMILGVFVDYLMTNMGESLTKLI